MTIKKVYEVGDSAWVHGIRSDNKLVKGQVIKKLDLTNEGFSEPYYIISIPTHIEPLLEIRQWENLSQDERGPIGMYRDLRNKMETDKLLSKMGYISGESFDEEEPTPEQIHAALEKSQRTNKHAPLLIKTEKPKKRFYPRKKKQ
ncbi:MAG: hypothetical protein EBU90_09690 [Proteobacteria bacterium]|nr:hypothetical protein [Pseudomonadota bacterium]NBP16278.1 hypothetical protein [bacterium]